jgi:hypothetical protein
LRGVNSFFRCFTAESPFFAWRLHPGALPDIRYLPG